MVWKQLKIGRIGKSELFIHPSLIVATIIMGILLAQFVVPVIAGSVSLWLTVQYALLLTVALLTVTIGFEFGRFYYLRATNRDASSFLLLPLSSVLAVDQKSTSPRNALLNGIFATLPLFGLSILFMLLSLSPSAGTVQSEMMRQLSSATLIFALVKQIGLFALDRSTILYGFAWLLLGKRSDADNILRIWRNSTIFALIVAAILLPLSTHWLGSLLCLTIAWGLYDAIGVRRAFRAKRRGVRSGYKFGMQES